VKKSTSKLLRHSKLVINAETLIALTTPQLGNVVGGSVDFCQGESDRRGPCAPLPHTSLEEA
jgi:hypothetical protein